VALAATAVTASDVLASVAAAVLAVLAAWLAAVAAAAPVVTAAPAATAALSPSLTRRATTRVTSLPMPAVAPAGRAEPGASPLPPAPAVAAAEAGAPAPSSRVPRETAVLRVLVVASVGPVRTATPEVQGGRVSPAPSTGIRPAA